MQKNMNHETENTAQQLNKVKYTTWDTRLVTLFTNNHWEFIVVISWSEGHMSTFAGW